MAASVETLSFPLLEVENLSKRFVYSAALTSIGPMTPTISFSRTENEIHPDSGTIAWQKRPVLRSLPSPVSGKIGVWSKAVSLVYFDDYRVVKNAP